MHEVYDSRPVDAQRATRRPLGLLERIKFLVIFGLIWLCLVWSMLANNPLVGFSDAVKTQVHEAVRQVHFLISEHWRACHRFWTVLFFGGFERLTHRRLSDWTRFRLARLLAWLFWLVVIAFVVSKFIHTSPLNAAVRVPQLVWHDLPFAGQILVYISIFMLQFALLLWFMSRGGVDVYQPSCSLSTRNWSRNAAATCLAACCYGTARHRQAVRVRRPGRIPEHVHGCRHPQGQGTVPQAAPASPALRRRDRVLRRSRLPRQPPGNAHRQAATTSQRRSGAVSRSSAA
jgi:hypothetical protein